MNNRNGVPAGWTWRDGRPRWIPSPRLREAGWKGRDLRDAAGAWLARGASIDAAQAIVRAVEAWRAGAALPAAVLDIAPPGAAAARPASAPADRFAIGALVDAWLGDPERGIEPSHAFAEREPKTQGDYRSKLKRLIDVLAGWVELPARGDVAAQARYAAAVAEVRASSVFILEPVEPEHGGELVDLLYNAYHALKKGSGVTMAAGVLTVASVWLEWCHKRRSRRISNWARGVERQAPPGRIRVGTWAEVKALVDAADAMGLPSVGDAVVLGLDLSWSQGDRLALTWPQVDAAHRVHAARQKTGRKGGTPLTYLGIARLAQIRERQAAMTAKPTHVIWSEVLGAPYKPDYYRKTFAKVRAAAALKVPSVAEFWEADLRDTAFSWARNAGLSDDMTASRTLQSRENIAALGDKHYGEIGPEIADQGVEKLNRYLRAMGVAL